MFFLFPFIKARKKKYESRKTTDIYGSNYAQVKTETQKGKLRGPTSIEILFSEGVVPTVKKPETHKSGKGAKQKIEQDVFKKKDLAKSKKNT